MKQSAREEERRRRRKKAPLYLKAGDRMRLGIAKLGEQSQAVVPFKLQR